MHTYIKAENEWIWTVGLFTTGHNMDGYPTSRWHPIRDFVSEENAAAFCSYLNGGERPAAVEWNK